MAVFTDQNAAIAYHKMHGGTITEEEMFDYRVNEDELAVFLEDLAAICRKHAITMHGFQGWDGPEISLSRVDVTQADEQGSIEKMIQLIRKENS